MEKKNNFLRVRSLSFLWALLAILLCAAPCGALDVDVGEPLNVGVGTDKDIEPIEDDLYVFGTVNLYPGAIVDGGIYVFPGRDADAPGGTVNVYGCGPGNSLWVMESSDTWQGLPPVVTVYGERFQIETGEPFAPPADKCISGTLNVLSESDDEVLFSLYIASDIEPIHLKAPGDEDDQDEEEPLKAQLLISPKVIQCQSRMPNRIPKILAMIRLPEGVTKDDVDSDNPLVLYANNDEAGTKASCQRIIKWRRRKVLHVSILAFFDTAELMEAFTDNGEVELKVVGQLKTGQQFYGSDTIRIIGCRQRPWGHIQGAKRHKNR